MCFEKVGMSDNRPAGIIIHAYEKSWMETELVVDWLKVVWGRQHGGLRNMLVLDAFH